MTAPGEARARSRASDLGLPRSQLRNAGSKEIRSLDQSLDVLNEIIRRNSPDSRDWAHLSYEDFNEELATWITEIERELEEAGIDPVPLAMHVYKSANPYVRLLAIRWYYFEVGESKAKTFTQFMEFTKDPLLSVGEITSVDASAEAKLAQVMTDWLLNLGGWPSQEVSGYQNVMSTATGGRRILRQMGVAPVKP